MGKIFHPGGASGLGCYGTKKQNGECSPVQLMNSLLSGGKQEDMKYSWDYYYKPPNENLFTAIGPPDDPTLLSGCPECGNSWAAVPKTITDVLPLPDTQTADFAVNLLEDEDPDFTAAATTSNFFLAVGFHKPHTPFVAPEEFYDLYPLSTIHLPRDQLPPANAPSFAWQHYEELRAYPDIKALDNITHNGSPGYPLPENVTRSLRRACVFVFLFFAELTSSFSKPPRVRRYYACVSYTDHELGRVLNALDASRYTSNTVVTLVGDHGFQIGEHGEWMKHTNWNLATNTPLFLRVPGITEVGFVSNQYAENVDLFPTIVEAALGEVMPSCPSQHNVTPPTGPVYCTEGTSLMPILRSKLPPLFVPCRTGNSPRVGTLLMLLPETPYGPTR